MGTELNTCDIAESSLKQKLHIFKFGGSCFKNEPSFNQSFKIVEHFMSDRIIVVCSALFGITDKLLEFGNSVHDPGDFQDIWKRILTEIKSTHLSYVNELFKDNQTFHENMVSFINENIQRLENFVPKLKKDGMIPENSDYVVSFGERMSTYLFSQYLAMKGIKAEFISTDDNLIITNQTFGNALPIIDECEVKIRARFTPYLKDGTVLVIPGFYGTTKDGRVSTLGRGGSDFTTTIIGYCLANDFNVNVIFWKDVYGILSANPKIVSGAKLLRQISYGEAKELTFLGSKILHPKCLKMAEQRDGTVEIRNFNDPFASDYTMITRECVIPKKSTEIIKGITSLDTIALVTIESDAMISLPGSAAKIFSLMGQYNININFISQCSSENNITFGTSAEFGFKAGQILSQNENFGKDWFKVKVDHDVSLVSVVGAGMIHKPGVAGLLFTTLGNAGINIKAIAQGSSEMNITIIIDKQDLNRAIKTLYSTFVEGNIPTQISEW
jgi:aspartate kinase